MGFAVDRVRGLRGEELVVKTLQIDGIECDINEDKDTNIYYDIACKMGRKKFTVEVKSDYMAEKTGNLAIEYYNSKKGTPSGVTVTKADLWVHCIKDGTNLTVWATSVKNLKAFIAAEEPIKKVEFGGDDNASLLLYSDYHILEIFERLDNLPENQIKKAIKRLL